MSENQNKTIEEKSEGKHFFNKRNTIILILTSILSLGLIVLTISFVLKMDWNNFLVNIGNGLTINLGALWLTLLILFTFASIFYNCVPMWIRLRKLGIKVSFVQYFCFALSISFFKGVTPANFVYHPYTIFWLKTQGVSTSRATSLMFSNLLIWQFIQFIIHIPSYIIVMLNVDQILAVSGWGVVIVTLMSLGITFDIVGCILLVLLCFSKTTHSRLSSIFNWFKKKLHLKYHTKAEIEEKYKNKATIKRNVIEYYKDWKSTLLIVLVLVAYEFIVYFSFSSALALINPNGNFYTFSVIYVFHAINMSFCANKANILPGFAMLLEAITKNLVMMIGRIQPNDDVENFVSQGMFLWRSFYTYFPTLMGLIGFACLTSYQVKSYKIKKGAFVASKYE